MLEGFLHCTGASASGLAERARDPEFLAALLDFLMTDDAGIIGFSRSAGLAPEIIPAARAALPGGDLPNWT